MSFYVREFSAIITVIYIDWFFYWSMYRLLQICSPCCFFLPEGSQKGLLLFVQTGPAQRFYACEPIPDGVRVRTPDRLHEAVTEGWREGGAGSDWQTVTPTTPGQIFYLQAVRMRCFSAVRRVPNEVDRLRVASKPRLNCIHLLRDPISRW